MGEAFEFSEGRLRQKLIADQVSRSHISPAAKLKARPDGGSIEQTRPRPHSLACIAAWLAIG
jgi:hypothetical protein